MDLQKIVLAIEEIVDVTTRLWHQPTLNQASAPGSISLSDLRETDDAPQRLFEFVDKQLFAIPIFAPPRVFGLKLRTGLIKQDDFHDERDIASDTPMRPPFAQLARHREPDLAKRAAPLAPPDQGHHLQWQVDRFLRLRADPLARRA